MFWRWKKAFVMGFFLFLKDKQSNIQLWSELFAHLVNMIKDGCKNKSALFSLFISHQK